MTSMDFDRIHSHQPGPTSAQQKRNQHSTHRCSLCSRLLQKSVQVPCSNLNNSCTKYRRLSSWRPVVSRADVRNIGFAPDQMLGTAEIAQLEDSRLRIKQKILGEKLSWIFASHALTRLPGAWCLCGRCRLSGCTQETWRLTVFTLAQTSLSNVKTSQSTWRAGTCRAWWRWPEWFASACCTVLPPKGQHWWESSQVKKYSRNEMADWNFGSLWWSNGHLSFIDFTRCQNIMYVPCTQSQGYTPGLGSGKSHPDKSYVIRFTNKLCLCATVQRLGNIPFITHNNLGS